VWRAAAGNDQLRRCFAETGFDDGGWVDLPVPGHWRSAPGLEACDGPVLQRRTFEAAAPGDGRRSFVVLEGCFYQGDVWLDGAYLGDTEGYFVPHAFEVTDQLRARREHLLAVELACAPRDDRTVERNLTGVFQGGGDVDPDWNPGGIWRPVHLVETGPVRIASLRLRCTEATPIRARLHLTADLDASEAGEVALHTTVVPAGPLGAGGSGVDHRLVTLVTPGANKVSWWVDVAEPALWWPRALEPGGASPALVDVEVQASVLRTDATGGALAGHEAVSDVAVRRTGLRQVRMNEWVLEVNGERLFVKGTSLGPTRMALGAATINEIEGDVTLAQAAGLDLARVRAHVARPELYEAADRAGLLLWQDLPLEGSYARGIRRQAIRQARAAVDLLAHHPSIALWCSNPDPPVIGAGERVRRFACDRVLARWSTMGLAASLAVALDQADGSRPVVPRPGGLAPRAWGIETYTSFGWNQGDERGLPRRLRRFPVLARFVGELGAQSVPGTVAWMAPEQWPELDWERLGHTHGMRKAVFDRRVPPAAHRSFEAWQAATQEYQANVLRHHVEELRRLKYQPAGGFCQSVLADSHVAVSCSVLDHERVPKAGYAALQAACAPVIVVADRLAARYRPGDAVALDVHVVSDLRQPLDGCTVRAELAWSGGSHRWGFVGEVPADTVVRVGTLSFMVPDAPGPLTLDLSLEGTAAATAAYRSEIVPVT